MRRPRLPKPALAAAAALAAALALAAPAQALQLEGFDVTFTDGSAGVGKGAVAMAAGEHPDSLSTSFEVAQREDPPASGKLYPVEAAKDLSFEQVPGLAGIPSATPRCTSADFLEPGHSATETGCDDATAIGAVAAAVGEEGVVLPAFTGPVYNLQPAPGHAARFGFKLASVYVTVDAGVSESPPYRILATLRNVSQILEFFSSRLVIWGVPADPAHDPYRGKCLGASVNEEGEFKSKGKECPAGAARAPFLVNPRACAGPLRTDWLTTAWQHPGAPPAAGFALTHDAGGAPRGFSGCGELPFGPEITAAPSSRAASSPSGLDFSLDVPGFGLDNPSGRAGADIEKAVVALPRGMTVNPSQAEGLEVCSEAQLARESAASGPGEGCPQASKIGTIEVETPLLPEALFKGSLYVAEPYRNPFGTLIALYVVIKDPELGVKIVQPLKVVPDPADGRLITYSEGMPQLPFSAFRLHFREGARAPLITPPGCGRFEATATLYPYSGGPAVTSASAFEIASGPDNGPCPAAAPFDPGFEAGTRNNAAGRYSPFDMRITRRDGEQDITKFSSVLPPGVVARLAATTWCPEAGIARARGRGGEHGGSAEREDPSCPPDSRIGTTVAGAGAGGQLTYVPGSLYLAGPYNGAPLSVVAITPAVAGPFDAGTVVVREALTLNPRSGVAEVDGSASDPIPHILQGIPLNLRELQVHADKPEFTLNATSCAEERARATLWGGGTALAPAPDTPLERFARYQASSCASLAFRPRLAIRLSGGTRRGAHPALRAIVRPRRGQANFARAAVTLPHSAFLEQAHIRTVCTRVQFAAGPGHGARCPKGAVYGRAKAWSPLIEGPATGPVYLRSSKHKLPDLVVALNGPASAPVQVELSARIDSLKGGIRSIFTGIPDLPVSRFALNMQGGKKGLIVNSRNLCRKAKRNRANARLAGQNGRRAKLRPLVRATRCARAKKRHRSHRRR